MRVKLESAIALSDVLEWDVTSDYDVLDAEAINDIEIKKLSGTL